MTTYNFREDGNDSLSGIGDANALASVGKFNSMTFSPGDFVLFHGDGTWRGQFNPPSSGTAANPITIGRYGTGANPKFFGSVAPSSWTLNSTNVWRTALATDPTSTNPSFQGDVFFVLLSGVIIAGFGKKSSLAALTQEFDWFWSAGQLYVFAATSPGVRYTSVEASQYNYNINAQNRQGLVFDSLDLRYSQWSGIVCYSADQTPRTGLTIANSEISFVGCGTTGYGVNAGISNSWMHHNKVHHCGRRGISASIGTVQAVVTGWLAEFNEVYNNNHTGFDLKVGPSQLTNVVIRNNYVWEDPTRSLPTYAPMGEQVDMGGCDIQSQSNNSNIKSVKIYKNRFRNLSDKGINVNSAQDVEILYNTFVGSHPAHETAGTAHVAITPVNAGINRVKGNIFYGTAPSNWTCLWIPVLSVVTEVDYNLYFMTGAGRMFVWNSGSYNTSQWSAYKAATGFDAHSPAPADPKFISIPNSDFTLQSGSPAIDKGVTVVGVTDGFSGSAPDLGAFEFSAAAPTLQPGQWAYDSTTGKVLVRLPGDVNPNSQPMSVFDWRFGMEEILMVTTAGVLRGRLCRHFGWTTPSDASGLNGGGVSYDSSRVTFASNWGGGQKNVYTVLTDPRL